MGKKDRVKKQNKRKVEKALEEAAKKFDDEDEAVVAPESEEEEVPKENEGTKQKKKKRKTSEDGASSNEKVKSKKKKKEGEGTADEKEEPVNAGKTLLSMLQGKGRAGSTPFFTLGGRRVSLDIAIVGAHHANSARARTAAARDGACAAMEEGEKRRRYDGLAITTVVLEVGGRPGASAKGGG